MTRRLGATTACLLALALLVGSVCGPTCSGVLCAAKSATHQTKKYCHGMDAPTEVPVSVTARPEPCNLATAAVPMLVRPLNEASTTLQELDSAHFLNVVNKLAIAADRTANSLFGSKDSPPNLPDQSAFTVVLRI